MINDLVEADEIVGDPLELHRNYRKGINKGLLKILSKMGISTIASYRGAQLFEAVGLSNEIVDLCFGASKVGSLAPISPTLRTIRKFVSHRPGRHVNPFLKVVS